MSNEQDPTFTLVQRAPVEQDGAEERPRVEQSPSSNHPEGRNPRGPSIGGFEESDDGGAGGEVVEADEYSLRRGPRPRISAEGLEDPAGDLLQAFHDGDPEAAYKAAKILISEHERVLVELAKLRYKLNFGTPSCENCDGLRAGPGVIATCFDLKQCHFTNLKRGQEAPRHLAVIQNLMRRSIPR